MDKPTIKFSHNYAKLSGHGTRWCPGKLEHVTVPVRTAVLLQVVPVDISTLSKAFIDYDTDNGKYKLEYSGWYMMLIFQKHNGDLFTSLRPQFNRRGDKRPYYDALVGREFDIVITQ